MLLYKEMKMLSFEVNNGRKIYLTQMCKKTEMSRCGQGIKIHMVVNMKYPHVIL